MAYAIPADVAAGFRPLTGDEASVAQTLLDRAERILLARVPSIPARIADLSLNVETVIDVEAAMVERVLRNPEAKKQEAIDDYSWTRDTALSSGSLYVSDDEVARLSPAITRSRSASVIRDLSDFVLP